LPPPPLLIITYFAAATPAFIAANTYSAMPDAASFRRAIAIFDASSY